MSRWQESISETLYELQGKVERLEHELSRSFCPPARPTVKFRRLHKDAGIPEYQTSGAAGMDLVWDGTISYGGRRGPEPACFEDEPWYVLEPECSVVWFHTGLAIEIPTGYEGQARARSSTGGKGIIIPNAPATIDSDYRGELVVMLVNVGVDEVRIERGDRIAQLVIAPVAQATIVEVEELSETARGTGGLGSTGR